MAIPVSAKRRKGGKKEFSTTKKTIPIASTNWHAHFEEIREKREIVDREKRVYEEKNIFHVNDLRLQKSIYID
jgi:hypothetical protein